MDYFHDLAKGFAYGQLHRSAVGEEEQDIIASSFALHYETHGEDVGVFWDYWYSFPVHLWEMDCFDADEAIRNAMVVEPA